MLTDSNGKTLSNHFSTMHTPLPPGEQPPLQYEESSEEAVEQSTSGFYFDYREEDISRLAENKLKTITSTLNNLINTFKNEPDKSKDSILGFELSIVFTDSLEPDESSLNTKREKDQVKRIPIYCYATPQYQQYSREVLAKGQALYTNSGNLRRNVEVFRHINNRVPAPDPRKQFFTGVLTCSTSGTQGQQKPLEAWQHFGYGETLFWKNIYRYSYSISVIVLFNVRIEKESRMVTYLIRYIHEFLNIDAIGIAMERTALMQREIEKQTRKAAAAAVMARNMSHNIGSHVLVNVIEDLKKAKALQDASDSAEEPEDNQLLEKTTELLGYLQSRMEFIADIATTQTTVTAPLPLKKDVMDRFYDPGNLHGGDAKWQKLVMRHISGAADVCVMQDGNGIVRKNIDLVYDEKSQDTLVAFPNELMGAQALYIIFENLIRNAVKHAIIPSDDAQLPAKQLRFLVRLEDIPPSGTNHYANYYKLVIIDNLGEANHLMRSRRDFVIHENYQAKKVDFTRFLNHKIEKSIVKNNALRQGDWGLLEIKICSAYLRKINIADIDERQSPPLTRVAFYDDKGNKQRGNQPRHYNLGYEFYLKKPKIIMCLLYPEVVLPPLVWDNMEKLKRMGIDFIDLPAGVTESENGVPDWLKEHGYDARSEHEFMILVGFPQAVSSLSNSNQTCLYCNVHELCEEILQVNQNSVAAWNLHAFRRNILLKLNPSLSQYSIKPVDAGTTTPPAAMDIVFDNHGHYFKRGGGAAVAVKQSPYYESFITLSPTNTLLGDLSRLRRDQATATEAEALRYELIQAALVPIAVVDERVQLSVYEQAAEGDKSHLDPARMKIFIPPAEIALYSNSFNETVAQPVNGNLPARTIREALEEWLRKLFSGEPAHWPAYLLVHLGIIEKMLDDPANRREEVKSWIQKWENEHTKVIVVSGRGRATNLPEGTLYLPFTLLNQYLVTYRSKLYLYRLIKSIRKQ